MCYLCTVKADCTSRFTEMAEKVVNNKCKQILAKNDCQKFAQNKNSP